jgi:putative N6-adenine-specific DNA methylase
MPTPASRRPVAGPADRTRHTQPWFRFFAPCPRGLEAVLAAELTDLGASAVNAVDAGVGFVGDWGVCYRANLESRIASRILWQLGEWDYQREEDVYRRVRALPWHELFAPQLTIRVKVSAIGSPLRSLDFITLRIKDAVCDRFRADTGIRPNVDTTAPGVRIHGFFEAARFALYVDTSGEALFKRGWRQTQGDAPLRENLAAGILALTGWRPGIPLLDPMCGSGTLLVEAAMMALGVPAGGSRSFGFQRLRSFDVPLWELVRAQARKQQVAAQMQHIFGADLYGEQLKLVRANLAAAGLQEAVSLKQGNVLELPAPARSGVIVTNPPYGVRLGDQQELAAFYPQLGDALKVKYAGWRAWIFTGDLRLPKLIGLKPARRIPLYNGALECRLYAFEIVAGSMRRRSSEASGVSGDEQGGG